MKLPPPHRSRKAGDNAHKANDLATRKEVVNAILNRERAHLKMCHPIAFAVLWVHAKISSYLQKRRAMKSGARVVF